MNANLTQIHLVINLGRRLNERELSELTHGRSLWLPGPDYRFAFEVPEEEDAFLAFEWLQESIPAMLDADRILFTADRAEHLLALEQQLPTLLLQRDADARLIFGPTEHLQARGRPYLIAEVLREYLVEQSRRSAQI